MFSAMVGVDRDDARVNLKFGDESRQGLVATAASTHAAAMGEIGVDFSMGWPGLARIWEKIDALATIFYRATFEESDFENFQQNLKQFKLIAASGYQALRDILRAVPIQSPVSPFSRLSIPHTPHVSS